MSDEVLIVSRQGQLAELWARPSWRVAVYFALSVVLGAVGGLLWSALTPLSSYTVRADMRAYISERGQTQIVAADVVFTIIVGVIGLLIGAIGWMALNKRGWLVTFVPLVAALAAALMAWRLGLVVGQSGFTQRLASASPGDVVSVDLQLRSLAALLVAPFAAVTPVMLLAAFWPEPRDDQLEDPVRADH